MEVCRSFANLTANGISKNRPICSLGELPSLLSDTGTIPSRKYKPLPRRRRQWRSPRHSSSSSRLSLATPYGRSGLSFRLSFGKRDRRTGVERSLPTDCRRTHRSSLPPFPQKYNATLVASPRRQGGTRHTRTLRLAPHLPLPPASRPR